MAAKWRVERRDLEKSRFECSCRSCGWIVDVLEFEFDFDFDFDFVCLVSSRELSGAEAGFDLMGVMRLFRGNLDRRIRT